MLVVLMVQLQMGEHHFLVLLLVLEVVRQSSILNLEFELVLEQVVVLVEILLIRFEGVLVNHLLIR